MAGPRQSTHLLLEEFPLAANWVAPSGQEEEDEEKHWSKVYVTSASLLSRMRGCEYVCFDELHAFILFIGNEGLRFKRRGERERKTTSIENKKKRKKLNSYDFSDLGSILVKT